MGYNLTIGNAKPWHSNEYGELSAGWSVEHAKHNEAPAFPNDVSQPSNVRSPSYCTWREFAELTGLVDLFYCKDEGLLREHPGCVLLEQHHHTTIVAAVQRYQRTRPPGFGNCGMVNGEWKEWDTDLYDGTLARLLWLEWWVRWALANCETPAFENG